MIKNHILFRLFLFLWVFLNPTSSYAKQDVEFYIYFDKPPFIVDKEKKIGLSYEFMDALNQYSEKYNYKITYLPKKRAINFAKKYSGVLWTNNLWVNDPDNLKFNWITDLIFEKELYITNDEKLTYESVESLYGKVFVTVRGYTYFNLEDAFNSKKIKKVEVHNEKVIPLMLISNKADVGVVGHQTYQYIKRTLPEAKNNLYTLTGYKKEFYRSILIDKSKPELKQDIESWLNSDNGKKVWQSLKNKWLTDVH